MQSSLYNRAFIAYLHNSHRLLYQPWYGSLQIAPVVSWSGDGQVDSVFFGGPFVSLPFALGSHYLDFCESRWQQFDNDYFAWDRD